MENYIERGFKNNNWLNFLKREINLFIKVIFFLLLYSVAGSNSAEAVNVVQLIADHVSIDNPSQIVEDYENNNKKWVAYFHAGYGGLDICVAVDLIDYLQISQEGKLGWVTIWADVNLGVGIGLPFGFGAKTHSFSPNAPDSFEDLFDCTAGANALGFAANRYEVSYTGGVKELTLGWSPNVEYGVGAICSVHGISFEIKREKLNEIIYNALIPGASNLNDFAELVTTRMVKSDSNDVSWLEWLSAIRLTTNADDPDFGLIQDIYYDDLVVNEWGAVTIQVLAQDTKEYKVEVRGPGMFGSPFPEWDWNPRVLGPVTINSGNVYEFQTNVMPDDEEGDFGFWLYQKDSLNLYKILEKVQYPALTAMPFPKDNDPPTVINHYTNNDRATNIIVTFSENMEELTFTNETISIDGQISGEHDAVFSFDTNNNELLIDPIDIFSYGERVTITITSFVQDKFENEIANQYEFDFNIQDEPTADPTSIAVNVHSSDITIDPYDPITIFGTATYNNGIEVDGTAIINTGNGDYTAAVVDGSFSRTLTGPSYSRSVIVTVNDGTISGNGSIYISVDNNGGTSRYDLDTYVAYDIQDEGNGYSSYSYKDVYTTTDDEVNGLFLIDDADLSHDLDFKLKFYSPDGSQYGSDLEEVNAFSRNWEWGYWYWGFLIDGSSMAYTPGKYKADFYVDDDRKATHYYVVGWNFVEHRMARDVDTSDPWMYRDATNIFSIDDSKAVAWHEFEDVGQDIYVKTNFYSPDGALYLEGNEHLCEFDLPEDYWYDWYRYYQTMAIKGTSAEYMCGEWTVKLFVKNPTNGSWEQYYTDIFRIEEKTPPTITNFSMSPDNPIETQGINITLNTNDDNHLDKVTLHWKNGTDHSKTWDEINAGSYSTVHNIGVFETGATVSYWMEAWDESGNRTESTHRTFTVQNEIVTAPSRPTGDSNLDIGQIANYTTSGSITSLGHPVEYQFEYGDGTQSNWGSPESIHYWSNNGVYFVKIRARCATHTERVSMWSSTLAVTVDSENPVIIIQPGPGANDGTDEGSMPNGKDTFTTNKYPGNNFGAYDRLNAGSEDYSTLIKFDINDQTDTVSSVIVRLFTKGLPGFSYNGDLNVYRVKEPWNEMTVTSSTKPAFDLKTIYATTEVHDTDEWVEFDITNLYREWKTGAPNYGIILNTPGIIIHILGDYDFAPGVFYSSDCEAPELRPMLVIEENNIASFDVQLLKGFNLISLHTSGDLKDLLPIIGDSSEIERVFTLDTQTGTYVTFVPGVADNPSFILSINEGLIVYAIKEKQIVLDSLQCTSFGIVNGTNLIGIACPTEGYSAYQFLSQYGSEDVKSVYRYSPEKGAFETASIGPEGSPVGVDFAIVPGEGYGVIRGE